MKSGNIKKRKVTKRRRTLIKSTKRRSSAKKRAPEKKGPVHPWITTGVIIAIAVVVLIGGTLIRSWKIEQRANEFTYNNFQFVPYEGSWVTEIQVRNQPYIMQFHHHPSDLESITFDEGALEFLFNPNVKQIFITLDADAGSTPVLGGVDIAKITGQKNGILNIPTTATLTSRLSDTADSLVITCDDANENVTVIWMHIGQVTRVAATDYCILVEGATAEDTVRAADRLAYAIIGIM